MVRRALLVSVCMVAGVATRASAESAGAADPGAEAQPAADASALSRTESGGPEDEDSAPDGLVSRASGRPDHPRTLEEIRKSGYIRVLTRNNDTSFFIYRGHRMGFDYELGKKLAQRLGIRVDMVVTSDWADMVPRLLRGDGDVIAAEVTITESRKKQVLFAEPWGKTREVVVYREGAPPIRTPEDLAGKELRVRKSSSYYETLLELSQRLESQGLAQVRISVAPEDWETDTILAAVSKGDILYTVADALLADIHAAYFDDLVVGPALSEERPLAWAVRPGDTRLRDEIDRTFRELRRKPDFNLLKRKYFEAERSFRKARDDRFYASETGTLSPYDALVRRYASRHGFDWRLVAAQIYQESHFDPRRRSWIGAVGLFQIMPGTARDLGIADPTDPEQSIRGGLEYMKRLQEHYTTARSPFPSSGIGSRSRRTTPGSGTSTTPGACARPRERTPRTGAKWRRSCSSSPTGGTPPGHASAFAAGSSRSTTCVTSTSGTRDMPSSSRSHRRPSGRSRQRAACARRARRR